MLTLQVKASSASTRIRTSSSIPVWYTRGNNSFLRLRFLENRVRLFLRWIVELLACFIELLTVCKEVESATNLQVYTTPSIIVCRISKITLRVERLFHTEAINPLFLATARMPALFFSLYSLTLSYRYRVFLIIDFVSVETKEMKQQVAQTFFVLVTITPQLVYIVGETR